MKKILAMMLSVILCLSMPFTVFATEDDVTGEIVEPGVYLNVDATGDELSVELVAKTAVTDGLATITYDVDTVTYEGYSVSGNVTMHSINATEEGTIKVSWISENAVTGTLFTFDFSGTEDTEITDETFTLEGAATDEDGNEVSLGVDTNTVDKSVLQGLYEASLTLTEEAYTEESWGTLEEAQEAALAVLNDADATQDEVDAAVTVLADAIAGLELADTSADKTALQTLYSSALLLAEGDYTEDSWTSFSTELAEALAVLENEDVTQEEVDAAFNELLAAIAALDPVSEETVNKEALLLVYETSLKLTEESWTSDSWAVLEAAQADALTVLNNEDATQEEVDAALATLTEAISALTAAANKEALEAVVETADAYNENDYTADSWTAFEEALEAAKNVLNDGNATQDEVDAALEALLAAEEGLTTKTSSTDSGDNTTNTSDDDTAGTSDDDTTDDDDSTVSGGKEAKTGDVSAAVLVSALAVFAAAVVVLLYAKKTKRQ